MKQSAVTSENYTKYPDCVHISQCFFNDLWSTITTALESTGTGGENKEGGDASAADKKKRG